ncbi:MAG: molybdenum cofactor guanylyltransferase MobA [Aquificaceae bacterium]
MIEAFILAGGISRRFGKDKLLHPIGQKKVIEHVVDTLKKVCHRVCIVAKDLEKFSFLEDVELIKDLLEKQYPLAGLYTALRNLSMDKALVISGDMPLVKEEVITYLWESFRASLTLYKVKGKYYPLFALYHKELLTPLESYINTGGERLIDFVLKVPHKTIKEEEILAYDPDLRSFINMNTPEEEKLILKIYGEGNKD